MEAAGAGVQVGLGEVGVRECLEVLCARQEMVGDSTILCIGMIIVRVAELVARGPTDVISGQVACDLA